VRSFDRWDGAEVRLDGSAGEAVTHGRAVARVLVVVTRGWRRGQRRGEVLTGKAGASSCIGCGPGGAGSGTWRSHCSGPRTPCVLRLRSLGRARRGAHAHDRIDLLPPLGWLASGAFGYHFRVRLVASSGSGLRSRWRNPTSHDATPTYGLIRPSVERVPRTRMEATMSEWRSTSGCLR